MSDDLPHNQQLHDFLEETEEQNSALADIAHANDEEYWADWRAAAGPHFAACVLQLPPADNGRPDPSRMDFIFEASAWLGHEFAMRAKTVKPVDAQTRGPKVKP